jgi:hypothetical protein
MSKHKPTGKPVGRPRLNLPIKPRHFLQVERNPDFDYDLLKVQEMLADIRELPVSAISQSEAVRRAVRVMAASFEFFPDNKKSCPRCNGVGYIIIRNGEDES